MEEAPNQVPLKKGAPFRVDRLLLHLDPDLQIEISESVRIIATVPAPGRKALAAFKDDFLSRLRPFPDSWSEIAKLFQDDDVARQVKLYCDLRRVTKQKEKLREVQKGLGQSARRVLSILPKDFLEFRNKTERTQRRGRVRAITIEAMPDGPHGEDPKEVTAEERELSRFKLVARDKHGEPFVEFANLSKTDIGVLKSTIDQFLGEPVEIPAGVLRELQETLQLALLKYPQFATLRMLAESLSSLLLAAECSNLPVSDELLNGLAEATLLFEELTDDDAALPIGSSLENALKLIKSALNS